MAVTKRSKGSKGTAHKATTSHRLQSPTVKETVLGMELVAEPRNAGNGWQDHYDVTFMAAHFPTYEVKVCNHKGKEFVAQCTDQYIKLFPGKCRMQFDPSLRETDMFTDKEGWDDWRKKKTDVFFSAVVDNWF
jgi:hypothetical protein